MHMYLSKSILKKKILTWTYAYVLFLYYIEYLHIWTNQSNFWIIERK